MDDYSPYLTYYRGLLREMWSSVSELLEGILLREISIIGEMNDMTLQLRVNGIQEGGCPHPP